MSDVGIKPLNVASASSNSIQLSQNESNIQSEPPKSNDKEKSNAMKLAIGATALASTIAVGILLHKHIKTNNMIKEFEKQLEQFKNYYVKPDSKIWDASILEKQLDELKALSLKERIAKFNEIKKVISNDRGLTNKLNLCIDAKCNLPLPDNIRALVNSGDRYNAIKMYIKYCDTHFEKSKTAGETIEKTLENVFGKNNPVKKHTYDAAMEAEHIGISDYVGGYNLRLVNSKNEIAAIENWKAREGFPINGCTADGILAHMKQGARPVLAKGEKDGIKFVSVSYPMSSNGAAGGFTLISKPNGPYTPAQNDLLSIDFSKLTADEISLIHKLPVGQENVNYDAVMSLIQTLAKK